METEKAIIDEYKKLVIKQKKANISVSEICANLGISRKTFYNYFRDRLDIIEKTVINDIEKPIFQGIAENLSPHDITYLIHERFLLEKNFYRIVIAENCQNSLFDNLIERFAKIMADCYERPGLSKKEAEYVNYQEAASGIMVFRKWAKEGMTEPIESIVKVRLYTNTDPKR